MKKQIFIVGITVLFVITGLSGCLQEPTTQVTEKGLVIYENLTISDLNFTAENYPKVDGSTSTHPLAVLIACKIFNISYHWSNYTENWFETIENDLIPNASEPGKEDIAYNIMYNMTHAGTNDAYVNLINKTADLILVARLPSDDELKLAENYSVELTAKPVALDAFIFLLNTNNSVNDLNITQIQKIYTGEITNWSEVGGNNTSINAYQREENSGSQELMKNLVMKNLGMIHSPNMILYGMMGPFNMLSNDKDGIGYTVYYYEEYMAPTTLKENIKVCGVNGIMPTYDNISTKTYPYTAEVYVVIRNDLDTQSNAYKLRDWLLGVDGQNVVQESGYVPVS